MTLPYADPLTIKEPADLTIPEPPRRGEAGGEPCYVCSEDGRNSAVWEDEHWTLHNPGQTALAGAMWLASKQHFDPYADMPADAAATLASTCGLIERAILSLGGIARVHVYRYGDGGAHFHLWFVPRPMGRLDMSGPHLAVWEDVMTPVEREELEIVGKRIAAALVA